MDLSIIIVSYNSRDFLHYTLLSVEKAIGDLKAEILIVDNASSDGSIEFLQPLFPNFRFVETGSNLGFARANNLGLSMSKGRFILFLNPDVIIAENSLRICLKFMNTHTDAGALGVRMIDGSGSFLPESKRGFPGVWNSASRFLKLSSLFPRSRVFAGYYLGHLPPERPAVIDVVSGAFMMVSKEVLDKTGGFDERYFMYGEDIDLSFTIQKSGYRNYYLPDTTIVHFKGESTSKNLSYYDHFYGAMNLFASKHLKPGFLVLKPLIKMKKAMAVRRAASQNEKQEIPKNVSLAGDQKSKQEAGRIMEANGVNVSESAEAVVFCQGDTFSFFSLIERMSAKRFSSCFIHCYGIGSVLFSPDSSNTGIALKTGK